MQRVTRSDTYYSNIEYQIYIQCQLSYSSISLHLIVNKAHVEDKKTRGKYKDETYSNMPQLQLTPLSAPPITTPPITTPCNTAPHTTPRLPDPTTLLDEIRDDG